MTQLSLHRISPFLSVAVAANDTTELIYPLFPPGVKRSLQVFERCEFLLWLLQSCDGNLFDGGARGLKRYLIGSKGRAAGGCYLWVGMMAPSVGA
jgi:hypothetical protein